MTAPGPNYGLLRAPSGNTVYSAAEPVSSNLEGFTEYSDLLDLLDKLYKTDDKKLCKEVNQYLRMLNETLPADKHVSKLKCKNLTVGSIIRRYRRVEKLSTRTTKNVLGWGKRYRGKIGTAGGAGTGGAGAGSGGARRTRRKRRSYRV